MDDRGPERREMVLVTNGPIDPNDALDFVADPTAGGTCLFLGTVRDHSERGAVEGITYEAWPELATRRLEELSEEIFARWPIHRVALLHRYGDLDVGDISVAIACSASHRAEAFEAARHGIERLKQEAPIWKREALASGEAEWVMGS